MNEQEKALLTIEKLFALTSSTNEHEASSAALAAVRLIRKHGLVVAVKGASPPTQQSQSPFGVPGVGFSGMGYDFNIINELMRIAREQERLTAERTKETQRWAREEKRRQRDKRAAQAKQENTAPDNPVVVIETPPVVYDIGTVSIPLCHGCGAELLHGEPVAFGPDPNWFWHPKCKAASNR